MRSCVGLTIALLAALVSSCSESSRPRLSEQDVLTVAEPALRRSFPETFEAHQPYSAAFRDGIWHVTGTLPESMFGGTPEAEVRDSDGEVVRVYHMQ
ncbi:MAG TPA: NTF2 fold immunity protein [Planctomycetaceae bacterium]|nr:NTF2 fold immunity protein [Planctomycetaceae bacterium]